MVISTHLFRKSFWNGILTARLRNCRNLNAKAERPRYDAFGRRIQKSSSSGTTNYLYDGSNSVEEVDLTGAELAHYSQGAAVDEPLAAARGGAIELYEQDGLSSVTSLTDPNGAVLNSYAYDAFGNVASSMGSFANPFLYTGRELDSETGLRYYRARYYDPATGRFLSEDPEGFGAGNNFYAYGLNNPVNFRDPSGMASAPAIPIPWGSIGQTVERGLAAACVESGICEVLGAAAGGGVILYMISKAKPVAPPNQDCGNKCKEILRKIYDRMEKIKVRYYEMMTDPLDLYNTAYDSYGPIGPGAGTWIGHGWQLLGEMQGLRNDITQAGLLGCPVPIEAWQLTNLPIPEKPGWRGFKP